MDVEIVSIGDEVLSGQTVNSNAAFLSRAFVEKGYCVVRHTVLPDQLEMIRTSLTEAINRADLTLVTGGLGPALDDVTWAACSPLFLETPIQLKNTIGTASGFLGNQLCLLPGVPQEMKKMFQEEAFPLIQQLYPVKQRLYFRRCTLCLLRELEVDPFLRTLKTPEVEIGIYPAYGSLQVVFRSEKCVDDCVAQLQARFSTFFIGEGTVEQAVHREMIARKKSLALAESCTGGAVASKLVALEGASLFFLGSIVAYSNKWKEHFLKVRHDTLQRRDAVSVESVQEMIDGLFEETEADFAVAVSGILGSKGAALHKSIGTVYIAVAERGEKADIGRISAPLERSAGVECVVQTALGALWRRLVHQTATFS